ncbi:dihydrolipoyl dehydrogenase [Methylonatrum kenyense]|uniref:dihydrolipoyl dehydrogenase n=1 Tax=Methylonatrum kenyense TaxID=455253 RepID=UPI0020C167B5|nr:dihydrolipoyl dehydrogenase [Methylonatrum kenyense]MCK8515594.1 dihydrolipoyl dehydrogenase [Methylonatrum kenyense]
MQTRTTDVAVIGAGSAGLSAYRAARAQGKSAVLIEGGPYGTTCARVGCMPSKLLIAAAEAAHHARQAAVFGVHADRVRVDGAEVMARVRRERDRFVGFVVASTESIDAQDRLHGYARFLDDHTLQVDEHTRVEAAATVIATGSRPSIPDLAADVMDRVVVNDDIFSWQGLPDSAAVLGTGVIALELGQALHRLGVRVRLFGRSGRMGPLTDPAVSDSARAIIAAEVPLSARARIHAVRRDGDGLCVNFEDSDGGPRDERFSLLVAATGRSPNLERLDLGTTSLQLDDRGVPLFDRNSMQCGDSPIFIAGDVSNDLQLLHEASDEGRIAGRNAACLPDAQAGQRRSRITVLFSEPQIATVGESWQSLQERNIAIGSVDFGGQGRSRVMAQNRGLLHVYADRASQRFLGAEMIGPRAEHLAHLLAWSHQQALTIPQMLAMPFYHPVIEEGLRTALREAQDQLQAEQAS